MPKELVAGVLENLLGEYVLNISKDTIKVGVVRGRIKLENVQLDGDLIGSHISGAVGLTGFCVLSCWAKKLRISVNWAALEKEPTRIEIIGMHLLCVPLLSSTAGLMCGSGSAVDPSCTLRTRAKRSTLARFERNFWLSEENTAVLERASNHSIDPNSEERENWKTKLKAKLVSNIEVTCKDIHIRVEVPFGALRSINTAKKSSRDKKAATDERAFAFGIYLDSFVASWDSKNTSVKDNTSLKVFKINDLAVYWDDDAPFLISDFLIGNSALDLTKVQSHVTDAMFSMVYNQHPTNDILEEFKVKPVSSSMKHRYICKPFSLQINAFLDEISCLAELLPCDILFQIKPQQYEQYVKLRSAMLAQKRFDTMLHQRPLARPTSTSAVAWWRYAIACVITRPNFRPWRDVIRIVDTRTKYIQLVMKKTIHSQKGNGFHSGLTRAESIELLQMEDLLPIEALLAFHLIALRKVLLMRVVEKLRPHVTTPANTAFGPLKRIKRVWSSTKFKSNRMNNDSSLHSVDLSTADSNPYNTPSAPDNNATQFTFQVHNASIALELLNKVDGKPSIIIDIEASGQIKNEQSDKVDLVFDMQRVDISYNNNYHPNGFKLLSMKYYEEFSNRNDTDHQGKLSSSSDSTKNIDSTSTSKKTSMRKSKNKISDKINSSQVDGSKVVQEGKLPPGVVFRVVALSNLTSLHLNIDAHPIFMVWNSHALNAITDFFDSPYPEMQNVFQGQLRNAATPLAHRAQVALLSPTSLTVKVNIDAPKFLVPITSLVSDGALFLDAGQIKINIHKPMYIMDTKYEVNFHLNNRPKNVKYIINSN